MAKTCPEIGLSNLQAVWVEVEDVRDVLQKPTPQGYILPRGNITMNQTPTLSDSEELSESLNVTAQFQNAVDAGEASIPTYLRLTADGSRMQGHALLYSAMGNYQAGGVVTAALDEVMGIDDAATEFAIDGVTGGIFPPRCIIKIDDEQILVGHAVEEDGKISAKHCVRGYAGTEAAEHEDDAEITVKSWCYYQDVCRETVSIWAKYDHVVLWGRGGTVTQTNFELKNESGQNVDYTVSFKQIGWAGPAFLKGAPSGKVLTVQTAGGDNAAYGYTVGAYIKNTTKKDDNSGAGYRISAVNQKAGTITVDGTFSGWADGDKIEPWLPESKPIGEVVESRTALVWINGHAGTIRQGSLSIGTPTEYKPQIGETYPSINADTKRSISLTLDSYFDRAAAVAIGRGYEGYETNAALAFGPEEGRRFSTFAPRVKMNMPSTGTDGAVFTLERTGAVLGDKGEDALFMAQE